MFRPTDKQRGLVETASSFGLSQADIAAQLDIDVTTLRKHFREELDKGKFKLDLTACTALAKLFTSKDERVRLEALKWWTARRMGWKETSVTEQTGKDGGPIEVSNVSAIEAFKEQIRSATERLEDKGAAEKLDALAAAADEVKLLPENRGYNS